MKVLITIGTRPQIIKASVLLDSLKNIDIETILVHTGQHYDLELSDTFFRELKLRHPDYNLGVGSGSYKYQIERGVNLIREVIERERPNGVLVIGDSNPALVGCLGALTTGTPLAHCEAGLRSGNLSEPEERNRIFIDSISDYLFSSSSRNTSNLMNEKHTGDINQTGDLLVDIWHKYETNEENNPLPLNGLSLSDFCLFTLHRRSNAYDPNRLRLIISKFLSTWRVPIVWPVHPGVMKQLNQMGLWEQLKTSKYIHLIHATSYLQMKWLLENCSFVITDSVGVQVEAYLATKLCYVLRNEMEYAELQDSGWSKLIPPRSQDIDEFFEQINLEFPTTPITHIPDLFGDGHSAQRMSHVFLDGLTSITSKAPNNAST